MNLLFQALWSEIDINETLVYSSRNEYPYIEYFHTLLRTDSELQKHYLSEQLYAGYTSGFFDNTNPNGGNYRSFVRHMLLSWTCFKRLYAIGHISPL